MSTPAEPAEAEALVLRYFREAWEQADPVAIDALVAEDYVDHDPPPGVGGSRADQRRAIELLRDATRDRKIHVIRTCACGDHVTVRHDTSWTQVAPLFGLPGDGRRVTVRGCDLYVVRAARIVESWHAESIRA